MSKSRIVVYVCLTALVVGVLFVQWFPRVTWLMVAAGVAGVILYRRQSRSSTRR